MVVVILAPELCVPIPMNSNVIHIQEGLAVAVAVAAKRC